MTTGGTSDRARLHALEDVVRAAVEHIEMGRGWIGVGLLREAVYCPPRPEMPDPKAKQQTEGGDDPAYAS